MGARGERRPLTARELKALRELMRRRSARTAIDLRRQCFGPQRDFVLDRSKLVAACCSRRAGKTYGFAHKMYAAGQRHPWSTVPYITNTRRQAKTNLWKPLQELNAWYGLGAKFNHAELVARLPNGAELMLGGALDEAEIERYRGPKYPLVVIDEMQSMRPFVRRLIEDIAEPATVDYDGQIMVGGTPGMIPKGYWHSVSKGREQGWSVHHWTLRDNPHLAVDPERWLADLRNRKGWTEETPKYVREYEGRWVQDTSSQVYRIGEQNVVPRFPSERADDWEYVLAIDLGFVGVSAFAVLAYSVRAGLVVVCESYQATPDYFGARDGILAPEHIAGEVKRLGRRYDFVDVEVDPGGLGAKFVDALRRRWQIPAHPAEKSAKLGAIEVLNGDLQAGRLLVVGPRNEELLHDAAVLEWDYRRVDEDAYSGNVSRADLVISDRTPDHLTDALTYGHRRCRAYLHADEDEDEDRPAPGTPHWEALQEQARDRRELEDAAAQEWWAEDL